MTPAPHDPLKPTETDDTHRRMLAGYAYGSPYAGIGARRELPPITDAEYIQHGRDQHAHGYRDGVWDMLKIVGIVVALSVVVVFVLLTR